MYSVLLSIDRVLSRDMLLLCKQQRPSMIMYSSTIIKGSVCGTAYARASTTKY